MNQLIGQKIAGRYRVDAFLGKGGMAEVYKVWDQNRSVHLAMKILHADLAEDKIFLRRFRREAQTLSKLQHPNIVRFYGLGQADELVFMLMEYVEGTTLRKEIFKSDQPFSLEKAARVVRPVCAALHYAHRSGFIHCDIKPANIMIHNNGTILVADFGIARMTEAATVTMVGAGTPAYMAPEQARGEEPVVQTDIYALGIILFEMLTGGERPFTGEQARTTGSTSEKIRWEQLNLKPPSPRRFNSDIHPELAAFILKCLEKKRENRYADILEFLSTFEELIKKKEVGVSRLEQEGNHETIEKSTGEKTRREVVEHGQHEAGKSESPENRIPERAKSKTRFVYIIDEDGTPLYHSLPASNNWSIWLKKGARLSLTKPQDEKRVGKFGQYIAVSDEMGNIGYVRAVTVSLESSEEKPRRKKLQITEKEEARDGSDAIVEEFASKYPPENNIAGGESEKQTGFAESQWTRLQSLWFKLPGFWQKNWILGVVSVIVIAGLVYTSGVFRTPGGVSSGGALYFASDRNSNTEIYKLIGKKAVQVTQTPKGANSWSPVLSNIGVLYFTSDRDGDAEIYKLVGKKAVQVTQTPKGANSWSPVLSNAGTLYFTSDRTGQVEIYKLVGKKAEQVTHTPRNANSWSPVLSNTGVVYFTSDRDGDAEIYKLVEKKAVQVTQTPRNANSWSPVLSNTGVVYFTSDRDGDTEIYKLIGKKAMQVTQTPKGANSWSPVISNTGVLYFTSDRDGDAEIYKLVGKKAVQVTQTPKGANSWWTIKREDGWDPNLYLSPEPRALMLSSTVAIKKDRAPVKAWFQNLKDSKVATIALFVVS
jgi:serine/threonine protein kinase/Tol biopolymer transport system component